MIPKIIAVIKAAAMYALAPFMPNHPPRIRFISDERTGSAKSKIEDICKRTKLGTIS